MPTDAAEAAEADEYKGAMRLPKPLHKRLTALSELTGISLNKLIVEAGALLCDLAERDDNTATLPKTVVAARGIRAAAGKSEVLIFKVAPDKVKVTGKAPPDQCPIQKPEKPTSSHRAGNAPSGATTRTTKTPPPTEPTHGLNEDAGGYRPSKAGPSKVRIATRAAVQKIVDDDNKRRAAS